MNKILTGIIFIIITGTITLGFSLDPKLLEYWQNTMKFGISTQRIGVIKAIEDNKTTEAYSMIQDALINDPNPDVRTTASYSLINLKVSDQGTWLKALTQETNSDVLRKIVFGVSELKIPNTGPKLVEILTNRIDNQKESLLSATVLRTIGDVGYKPAGDLIMGILTNLEYNAEIRGAAAIAIGEIGDVKNIPILKSIVDNVGEVKEVRMYSAYAIGKTGSLDALKILSPYIENESEDLNVRLWGIAGLAFVNDKGVYAKLIDFSKVDNVRIRFEAVKALGNLKTKESQDILTYKALFDPELSIKQEARKALQDMGVDVTKLGTTTTTTADWGQNPTNKITTLANTNKTLTTIPQNTNSTAIKQTNTMATNNLIKKK